jgi:SOUL heme-binding protein
LAGSLILSEKEIAMPTFTRHFFVLAAGALAIGQSAMAQENIEQPRYEIVEEADGLELRQYTEQIVAEVTVEAANMGQASNIGFRPLADFIFGNNQSADQIAMTAPVTTQEQSSGTKIAMTAPVTTAPEGDNLYTVRFSMPTEWTIENLPRPNNPAVRITQLPRQKIVAVRFVGDRSSDQIESANEQISKFMESRGLEPASNFIIAGYDGPYVPRSRRRWEVMMLAK